MELYASQKAMVDHNERDEIARFVEQVRRVGAAREAGRGSLRASSAAREPHGTVVSEYRARCRLYSPAC